MTGNYDLIVIGGGPAGLEAAQTAAKKKKCVLIIDRRGWGGVCTHRGCIPTKAMLTCSKFYTDVKKLKRVGVGVPAPAFDFIAMKKHRDSIVKIAALGAQKMLADAQVEMKTGSAEMLSARQVLYTDEAGGSQTFSADHLLMAWGGQPQLLPGIQISPRVMTSDEILNLTELPSSMIIVGGSFIGVEYATIFAELGVKVILVELLESLLPQEDEEAADFIVRELSRLGVAVYNSTRLLSLKESANGVEMQAQKNGEVLEMQADCVLLCTGRRPVLHARQLDRLGIDYDPAGVKINEEMMTTVSGVYAAGDVTGGMMLAHRAAVQGKIAVERMFGGENYCYDEKMIPSVVYTHPPVARVGYTEKQSRQAGLDIDVAKSHYSANIIARAELMGPGFVKAVFSQEKMIGAVVVGDHAPEILAPLSLAISAGLTRKQLMSWVIPHPTLGEVLTPLIDP